MRLQASGALAGLSVPVVRERTHAGFWTRPLKQAFIITAVWRVLIAIVGPVADYVMPRGRFSTVSLIRHGPHWPANPLTLLIDAGVRSDAAGYGSIALHGYRYSTTHRSSIAFYPLYPLLTRLGAYVVGNVWVAGMLVSTLCLFGVVVALHLWLQTRGMDHLTPRVTLLMLLFPWSLFYAAMYSESLYLLLAIATFVCWERRLPYGAALCAFLLTLSRPTGILVVPCLLLMIKMQRERDWRFWLAPLAAVGALLAFAVYQFVAFGTPFASENAQAFGPCYRTLHQGLSDLMLRPRPGVPPFFLALLLLIGIGMLATVPRVYRTLGAPYALYTALTVLFPVATGLISLERYVMVAFPVFAAFATNKLGLRTFAFLTVEAWLLVLMTAGFAAGWAVW
ncbi:MAG: hypothetical protein NVS2B16_02250 [Chloroflexota bacterium]